MCRPDFPIVPGGRETLQELIELSVAMRNHITRNHMWSRSSSEAGELVLHSSDFIEEPQRIERARGDPAVRP
jgi:hypothetical protein